MADRKDKEPLSCKIISYGFLAGLAGILLFAFGLWFYSVLQFFRDPNWFSRLIDMLIEMIKGFGVCCGGVIFLGGLFWLVEKLDKKFWAPKKHEDDKDFWEYP